MTNEQLAALESGIAELRKDIEQVNGKVVDRRSELMILMLTAYDAQAARIAELEAQQPAVAVPDGWIDPTDKTQKQYLPWIGEAVLFSHRGVTYYGQHTGGSFQTGHGVTARNFNTWECRWMYPPAAPKPEGGE